MSEKIDKVYLEAIKYGDMSREFEKLGIPKVWEPGKKKALMIDEALIQLKDLKELQAKNLEEEKIQEELALNEAKRKADAEKAEAKRVEKELKEKEKEEKKAVKALVKAKVTPEAVAAGIKNLDAQLQNRPTEAYRQLLLKKRSELEAMQAKF